MLNASKDTGARSKIKVRGPHAEGQNTITRPDSNYRGRILPLLQIMVVAHGIIGFYGGVLLFFQ